MKIKELFENDIPEGAPLVVTVISNLLKRGVEVRAYYKGDGGQVTDIKWDADHVTGITTIKMAGNFRSSLIINDRNLETLELHEVPTSSFSNKKMFILRKPDVVTEGAEAEDKTTAWLNGVDLEFKKIIKGAGWTLRAKPKYSFPYGIFGGTIMLPTGASREDGVLRLDQQHDFLMQLIIKKLLTFDVTGHEVSITPWRTPEMAKRWLTSKDKPSDVIEMLKDEGMHMHFDGSKFDLRWRIRVPSNIVPYNED